MSVWVIADCIFSPLGVSTDANYNHARRKTSGLALVDDRSLSSSAIYAGRLKGLVNTPQTSRFEQMCLEAATGAIGSRRLEPSRTLYILSTTKGNIAMLGQDGVRLDLAGTAAWLAGQHGFRNSLVVSNACVSGVMALIVAKRFLEAGTYDHALVVGADELSPFIVSGFESLHALSSGPCRPFDAERRGINLGEGAAAILLSVQADLFGATSTVQIKGGGLSNDANHISGPSRTGDELGLAIQQALLEAGKTAHQVDFISAHGTATIFNDEMEAKAFGQMELDKTPVNSLKGYFGHTLGAAGIVESVMSIQSLRHNEILASMGYEKNGVTVPLAVCPELTEKPLKVCLKTASGFGGCNAAIIIEKCDV